MSSSLRHLSKCHDIMKSLNNLNEKDKRREFFVTKIINKSVTAKQKAIKKSLYPTAKVSGTRVVLDLTH